MDRGKKDVVANMILPILYQQSIISFLRSHYMKIFLLGIPSIRSSNGMLQLYVCVPLSDRLNP
jgi:hypothetical protein